MTLEERQGISTKSFVFDQVQLIAEGKMANLEIVASRNPKQSTICLILILLSGLASVSASAEGSASPVVIKAACEGATPSTVLYALREEIGNSQKYRLTPNLADDGRMDVVRTINMKCTERNNLVAVATVFGAAKCFSLTNCHLSIDGSSIRADLCDSKTASECARLLFKAFDDYVNSPLSPLLKLN